MPPHVIWVCLSSGIKQAWATQDSPTQRAPTGPHRLPEHTSTPCLIKGGEKQRLQPGGVEYPGLTHLHRMATPWR